MVEMHVVMGSIVEGAKDQTRKGFGRSEQEREDVTVT